MREGAGGSDGSTVKKEAKAGGQRRAREEAGEEMQGNTHQLAVSV